MSYATDNVAQSPILDAAPTPEPTKSSGATFYLATFLFLRLLGFVFLVAFASCLVQFEGLYGENGISPILPYLNQFLESYGDGAVWQVPSFFWFAETESALRQIIYFGVGASLFVICNCLVGPALLVCWLIYLSIVSTGQEFMSFQWDSLLLEVGVLGMFLAPWSLKPRLLPKSAPPKIALWLCWWLLIRFMISAGSAKLISRDPTWSDLTALDFHYYTQPLPTWIAYYAHQLPTWFQKFSVVAMFLIEIGVPFFIIGPRAIRHVAGILLIFLQILIALTGNYTFFNLLTVGLCILLFDDRSLSGIWARVSAVDAQSISLPVSGLRRGITIFYAILVIALCVDQMGRRYLRDREERSGIRTVLVNLYPFRLVNSYGLFAVMTVKRHEIVVEGSADGLEWKEYEFKDKPGRLDRPPRFIAPHQPRLDWQMWFAALGSTRQNPWFIRFVFRLLQGAPPVLELLEVNPFPDKPPRFIRAQFYDYTFTTHAEKAETGNWWKREYVGEYLRQVSLRDFRARKKRE